MTINELCREQIVELKQGYLTRLADEGIFAEVVGRDYDEPSYYDLANANSIVPDDVIYENYADTEFSADDFSYQYPTLGEKVESTWFNSYNIADALMELVGFYMGDDVDSYADTVYADMYDALESIVYNIGCRANNKYEDNDWRTLWNILGMIGELGKTQGDWNGEVDYGFKKPHIKFPSLSEY